jgi:hypothetical protein
MFITKRYGGLSHIWTRVFPTEGAAACHRITSRWLLTACSESSDLSVCLPMSEFVVNDVWCIAEIGTEQGWHYTYPIHEWPINRITHYQGEAPANDKLRPQNGRDIGDSC